MVIHTSGSASSGRVAPSAAHTSSDTVWSAYTVRAARSTGTAATGSTPAQRAGSTTTVRATAGQLPAAAPAGGRIMPACMSSATTRSWIGSHAP